MHNNFKFWIDVDSNRIYENFGSNVAAQPIVFLQGDNIAIELHLVRLTPGGLSMMEEVEFEPDSTIRLAVGKISAAPTSGSFSISYGSDTAQFTTASTSAQIQLGLNNLASMQGSSSSVTVNKVTNSLIKIDFNEVGVNLTLSVDGSALVPPTASRVVALTQGSSSLKGSFLIKMKQAPVAYQQTWTAIEQPSVLVTVLTANKGKRVSIYPEPRTGSWTLSGTKDIETQSIDGVVLNEYWSNEAYARLGVGALDTDVGFDGFQYNVTKVDAYAWDFSLKEFGTPPAGYTMPLEVTSEGLVGYRGVESFLNLNTAEVEFLMDSLASVVTSLEVEVEKAGQKRTILQTSCVIKNDMIDQTSFSPIDFGNPILFEAPVDGGLYARQYGAWISFLPEDNQGITQGAGDLRYAQLSGATFTGKLKTTQTATTAGLNIGFLSAIPTTTVAGDLWLGDNLNFRDKNGTLKLVANSSTQNNFSQPQVIIPPVTSTLPALRITNTGTGESLRIEDESPESTPFIVGADGRVGIHRSPANDTQHKLAIYNGDVVFTQNFGLAFGDGTRQVTAPVATDLTGYATESFVTSQGYITSSALSGYATESFVYGLGYATESFVYGQGYATELFVYGQGYITPSALIGYLPLAGGTMTGKINLAPPTAGSASLNLGVGTAPTTSVAADIWITTNINFKDSAGTQKAVANTNTTNQFSQGQAISVNSSSNALRINQQGTGPALVVEDSTTPDTTAFVVDASGNVGIGVTSGFVATQKLEVQGNIKFSDSTVQSTAFTTAQLPTTATVAHANKPALDSVMMTPDKVRQMLMFPGFQQFLGGGVIVTSGAGAGGPVPNIRLREFVTPNAGVAGYAAFIFDTTASQLGFAGSKRGVGTYSKDLTRAFWASSRTILGHLNGLLNGDANNLFRCEVGGRNSIGSTGDADKPGLGWRVAGGGSQAIVFYARNADAVNNGTYTQVTTSFVPILGQWFDWLITYNGSGISQMYVNDTLVGTLSFSMNTSAHTYNHYTEQVEQTAASASRLFVSHLPTRIYFSE